MASALESSDTSKRGGAVTSAKPIRKEKKLRTNRPVQSAAPHGRGRWLVTAVCLGLLAITWLVFGRAAGFGFLNYDDSYYVYQNPSITNGLTASGLEKAFTRPLVGNWHPLTSISLMLDAEWWGLNAGGYHLTNVVLHSLAVIFLFLALRKMTGRLWQSAFVAALFAIHPLRAESVVWISERKDVLSGVFFGLSLLAYSHYIRKLGIGRYLILIALLILGLMSKPMLVTLPFLLLLLDYWPLGRFNPQVGEPESWRGSRARWLFLEKIPLFLVVAAASITALWSQKSSLEATTNWPWSWRIQNAVVSLWIYLRQMVWPADLAVLYPHPKGSLPIWLVAICMAGFVLVTAAILFVRKRSPYLFTGWFWYLGMLVPVIGLIQVGWQGHADRYTYLPMIGIYVMLTWGAAELTRSWRQKWPLAAAAALTIGVLMLVAWRQVGYWSSPIKLWEHTIAVTHDNDVAERGLGTALSKVGRVDEAIVHDREALRIRPGDLNGLTNLANALLQKGELPEAIEHYRELVRRRPKDSESLRNLGKAHYRNGQVKEAMEEFRAALRLSPEDSDAAYSLGNAFLDQQDPASAIPFFQKAIAAQPANVAAHYNLAIALQRNRQIEAAVVEFRKTLQIDPRHADAHNNLAIALLKKGKTGEAIGEWHAALQLQPNNAEMHNNLGIAFLQDGRIPDALAQWRETLRLRPDKVPTALTLAWILATAPEKNLRDGTHALEIAKQAFRLAADRNLMTYRVLAAAFAEAGKFQAAIAAAQEGADRATAAAQFDLADILNQDLTLYQQGIPLRDPSHGRGSQTAEEG